MDSVLVLHVYNSFDNELYDKKVGGIGLQNVKRRLSLLYPNKHRLEIINKKIRVKTNNGSVWLIDHEFKKMPKVGSYLI